MMVNRQTPRWRYMVDQTGRYKTRHNAVGAAAIINGQRDRIAPGDGTRATVWAYPACVCEQAQITLDSAQVCQVCGGVL